MNKKLIRAAALALVVCLLLAAFAGCGSSSKRGVEQLLGDFERACRKLDVEAMLSCINPDVAEPILNIMKILGIDDTEETLDKIVAFLGFFGDAGDSAEELISSIKIEPEKYEFNDGEDECSVTAKVSCGDESETVIIECIEKDGSWYISGFDD